jgi:hypothetical protein
MVVTDMCDGWSTFQKYYDGMYIKSLCNITRDYVTKWWAQQKMVVTDMCDG